MSTCDYEKDFASLLRFDGSFAVTATKFLVFFFADLRDKSIAVLFLVIGLFSSLVFYLNGKGMTLLPIIVELMILPKKFPSEFGLNL